MAESTTSIDFLVPDESNRIINIFDEINTATAKQFFIDLHTIDVQDKNIISQNNHKLSKYGLSCDEMKFPRIDVFLNSPGGSVYDGFAMYDLINKRDDLHCTGIGMVASAALFFMLGFKYENRRAYKTTSFLVHQVSSITYGNVAQMEEDLKETKRVNEMIFDIIIKNTKITQTQLEKMYKQKRDWWINAEEALKYNIISEII